jgi:hypothetical protein
MTLPATDPKAPSWEDYLEVFYAPSRVFARRGARFGGPLLVLFIAMVVVALGTYSLLKPLYDAEGQRAMADRLQGMTAEQREQAEQMSGKFAFLGPVAVIGLHTVIPVLLGILLWLVGKLLGAVQQLGAAIMVAVFSYFPRILAWPVFGLQAAILPEDQLKGFAAVSLGPARLVEPSDTNLAAIGLLGRLDIFVIWSTILLALGLRVTGNISTQKAIIAGIIMWVLGTLPPLIAYLRG